MRRKIFFAMLILMAWFGFVIEGSYALFTDTAGLQTNLITTGSLDLLISNSQSASSTTYADFRPGFTYLLSPGQSEDNYFLLKNTGGSTVPLSIDVSASLASNTTMSDMVTLTFYTVDEAGSPVGSGTTATLTALTKSRVSLGATVAPGVAQRFIVKVKLSEGYQSHSQSLQYDLMFTGTQII
jgi:hypothetical protein